MHLTGSPLGVCTQGLYLQRLVCAVTFFDTKVTWFIGAIYRMAVLVL